MRTRGDYTLFGLVRYIDLYTLVAFQSVKQFHRSISIRICEHCSTEIDRRKVAEQLTPGLRKFNDEMVQWLPRQGLLRVLGLRHPYQNPW